MQRARWLLLVCAVTSATVRAGPNDLRFSNLGNPNQGGLNAKVTSDAAFRLFARQFAAALNSANLMPPSTLGHLGFAFSSDLSIVSIDTGQVIMPTRAAFTGPLVLPSIHIRKGLPYSFELGGRFGWVDKSRMAFVTGEGKWAISEGFSYLPDVSLRAFVTRLLNSRELDLTTGGVDIGIGKPISVPGIIMLTPYAGWSLAWVGASTDPIDFAPERPQAETTIQADSQLQAVGTFEPLVASRNRHHRFYGGLRLALGPVQLGGEYSYAYFQESTLPDPTNEDALIEGVIPPAVTAWNASLGIDF
jgi:hypothetical protein